MKKIMNTYYRAFILLLLTVITISCDNFDEDINVDKNNVSDVPPSYLLTSAQRDITTNFADIYTGLDELPTKYVQHIAGKTYTSISRVEGEISNFRLIYAGGFNDLQRVIKLNTDESTKVSASLYGDNNNQIAVAKILLAYGFMNITDMWGHAPYSEALQGRENFSPKYDTQKEIYTGIINSLEEATNLITPGQIQGDNFYGGDMDKWKKFAASLLMRAGMRLSNVDETMARDAFTKGNSVGGFESNNDNALYKNAGDQNNANGYYTSFVTQNRLDYAMAHMLLNTLGENNDPRLPVYADPLISEATAQQIADRATPEFWSKYKVFTVDGKKYAGQPWGYSNGTSQALEPINVSFVGAKYKEATAPHIIMTYAEVEFLKAEAVARGWITGDAEDHYKNGILASMQYNGISDSDANDYINNESYAAYDPANYVKSIAQQKWLALFTQGFTAWAEWRRTGFPVLNNAPDAAEGRAIPRRRGYPQIEFDLNKVNVDAAVSSMGPDNSSTRVWWDGGNE